MLAALMPFLLGARCGPSPQEAGGAVLVAAPGAMLVGALLLFALWHLHTRVAPQPPWSWRPHLVALGLTLVGALTTAVALADTRAMFWVGAALWLYGCSYLALLLATWRIWLFIAPSTAYGWAWIPVALAQLVPAILAATGTIGDHWSTALWIWPGYFGIALTGVLIVVLIEPLVRARRRRAADPPQPPSAATPHPPSAATPTSTHPTTPADQTAVRR